MEAHAVPLLPCDALDEVLAFYRALGFDVTHEQSTPYVYGAVKHGELDLHFFRPKGATRRSRPACAWSWSRRSVRSTRRSPWHFARSTASYRRSGNPRISRLRKGQCRFNLIDPGRQFARLHRPR